MVLHSKVHQKINSYWVFTRQPALLTILILISISQGFESILLLNLLKTQENKALLLIIPIAMFRLVRTSIAYLNLLFQHRMEEAFDEYFFEQSLHWSQLQIRKPIFRHEISKALEHSNKLAQQILSGFLPGVSQFISMLTLFIWFSYKDSFFCFLLIGIIILETFSQLRISKNKHQHLTENLELFRKYAYLKNLVISHRSLREFHAYNKVQDLKAKCILKLRAYHVTTIQLLRSNSFLTIAIRFVQASLILLYYQSTQQKLGIEEIGIQEIGLGYALLRVFSAGTKMAGLTGKIRGINLSFKEINKLRSAFKHKKGTSAICNHLIENIQNRNAHSIINISGRNGSGKSSLILEILDKRDSITPLRVGFLFQDFSLIQNSILNNIVLFSPPPHQHKKINQALASSGFAECMHKYGWNLNTRIGEEFSTGHGISMGEWQKLALARTLYHGQDVLILDEPETFLDVQSRETLLNFLKNTKNLTIILISHAQEFRQIAHKIIQL